MMTIVESLSPGAERVRKAARYLLPIIYVGLYFTGIYQGTGFGFFVNFLLIMGIMWSFVRRKLPVRNYILAAVLTLFYFILYWTSVFDGLAGFLGLPDRWVLYGVVYTCFILGFGIQFIRRNRHSRYQVWRTISLIIVQVVLAFIIPLVMRVIINKEYYFSYLWPLKIEYFYPATILEFPFPFLVYSLGASLVLMPVLALTLGKRWYCSWVCGCGGLAETFGDKWRHLSDKSTSAWKFEKVSIYTVLGISMAATVLIFLNWKINVQAGSEFTQLEGVAGLAESFYGFIVSIILAGVMGVGYYPVLGSRVWCRFFCPMAALLGLIQKGGRFRISVKEDMCISCGNCSTYCEMGIDVRAYAQKNLSFTRASCVGCGICAHVCPRGVLKLENKRRGD